MFNQRAGGLRILHVPYKGVDLAATDLVSGYIPLLVANVTGHFLGLREAGKIRILALNGSERLKALPDVPTSNETVKNMVAQRFVDQEQERLLPLIKASGLKQ